ncbi:hypothetical protein LR48_Vigan08g030900 [Vigna angularis]|uniref:Uncharacterized protein n=1 Tax=Phaseolus angularis TaxID=3914 RepID=A0A0L9V3K9_PHAAN|nr:hypothetical protein LR48_Vigan08g030900 [Vigna angularis]
METLTCKSQKHKNLYISCHLTNDVCAILIPNNHETKSPTNATTTTPYASSISTTVSTKTKS